MRIIRVLLVAAGVVLASCGEAKNDAEVKASDVLAQISKDKSVEVVGKIVWDDVDFASVGDLQLIGTSVAQRRIGVNVVFVDCVFMGKVSATGTMDADGTKVAVQTKFAENVLFVGCDFRAEVNMDNALCVGNLSFDGCTFREKASMNGLEVMGRSASFRKVVAEKSFSLIYSKFAGNVTMSEAKFAAKLSMQEATVGERLFAPSMVTSKADFGLLWVQKNAVFNYCDFAAGVNFDNARFDGDLEAIETTTDGTSMSDLLSNARKGGKVNVSNENK